MMFQKPRWQGCAAKGPGPDAKQGNALLAPTALMTFDGKDDGRLLIYSGDTARQSCCRPCRPVTSPVRYCFSWRWYCLSCKSSSFLHFGPGVRSGLELLVAQKAGQKAGLVGFFSARVVCFPPFCYPSFPPKRRSTSGFAGNLVLCKFKANVSVF